MGDFVNELEKINERSLKIAKDFLFNVLKDYMKEYLKSLNNGFFEENDGKPENGEYQLTKRTVRIVPKICCKELEELIRERVKDKEKNISIFSEGLDRFVTSTLCKIIEESKLNITNRICEVLENFKKCYQDSNSDNNVTSVKDIIVQLVKFQIPILSSYDESALKEVLLIHFCENTVAQIKEVNKIEAFVKDIILQETKKFISTGPINNEYHLWEFITSIVYLFKRDFKEEDAMEIFNKFSIEMLMVSESKNIEVYLEIIAREFAREMLKKNTELVNSFCHALFGFRSSLPGDNVHNEDSESQTGDANDFIKFYALMSEERFECKKMYAYNLSLPLYFRLVGELYISSIKNNRANINLFVQNRFLKSSVKVVMIILVDVFLKCKILKFVSEISQEFISFYRNCNTSESKYVKSEDELVTKIFENFRNWLSKNLIVKSFPEMKLQKLIKEISCKAKELCRNDQTQLNLDTGLKLFLYKVITEIIIPEIVLNSQNINLLITEINYVFGLVFEKTLKNTFKAAERQNLQENQSAENCCCIIDTEILNRVIRKNLIFFSFYFFFYSQFWQILLEGFERTVFSGESFQKKFQKLGKEIVNSLKDIKNYEKCVSETDSEQRSKKISKDCVLDILNIIIHRICYHLSEKSCQKYRSDYAEEINTSMKKQLENEIDGFVSEVLEFDRYLTLFLKKGISRLESDISSIINYEEIKNLMPTMVKYIENLGQRFLSVFEKPVRTFALEYVLDGMVNIFLDTCNLSNQLKQENIDCLLTRIENLFNISSDGNKGYHASWFFEVSNLFLYISEIYVVNQIFEISAY